MDWEHRMLHAKQLQARGLKQWQIAAELNVTERTVRNYLKADLEHRVRKRRTSKLDPYKPIIEGIMNENPFFNNVVLQERLERQGYGGKISIVRDFTRGIRKQLTTQAVLRYETEPGHQAQVDWKEFGKQTIDGTERKLYAFVMTLGYSRKTFVRFVTSMKESVLLACHVRAFEYFGGTVERILYDNMTTADEREGRTEHRVPGKSFLAEHRGIAALARFPQRRSCAMARTRGREADRRDE
jgi:transposase